MCSSSLIFLSNQNSLPPLYTHLLTSNLLRTIDNKSSRALYQILDYQPLKIANAPHLLRSRASMADSVTHGVDQPAHPRPYADKSEVPTLDLGNTESPVSQATDSTPSTMFKMDYSTSVEPHSYPFESNSNRFFQENKQSYNSEFCEGLKAPGEGGKDAQLNHAGTMSRKDLQETTAAALELLDGPCADQLPIAKDASPYQDFQNIEYNPRAEGNNNNTKNTDQLIAGVLRGRIRHTERRLAMLPAANVPHTRERPAAKQWLWMPPITCNPADYMDRGGPAGEEKHGK